MLQQRMSPAQRYMRSTLRIVALVGTLLIGIVALALIVSQTPWFRDWLRKYVVRQSSQYVNGTVSIGSLGGNLFYGIELGDVAVAVNGEHILTLKNVEVKYSLAQLVSQGVMVQQIRVNQPYVLVRHDAGGWNLAKLLKRQQQEADRQGPAKPITLPDIQIVDGRLAIDDRLPSPRYTLPARVDGLNVKASFAYAPVHYSVTLERLTFNGHAPDLTVKQLTGAFATKDDDLNVKQMFLETNESRLTVDGVIHNYLASPSLEVSVSAPTLSLPEFGGVLPVVQGYALHPAFDVKADGPLERLRMALNVKSEAGTASGTVTADLQAPDLGVRGDVSLQNLNLAPILKDPAQRSDISGQAKVDIAVPGAPASASAFDRLRGRVVFRGPTVVAAGYRATDVRATVDMAGRRLALDARVSAYGGAATAKGAIVAPGPDAEPTQFDLSGRASNINLAALPASLNAPRIATSLSASAYHVKGSVGPATSVEGSATLAQSTIAGGTILTGTAAEFSITSGPAAPRRRGARAPAALTSLTYAGRGEVRDLNIRSVGEAFQIAALAKPEYDSRINTRFDVKGSGTDAARMTVDATGSATDSHIFGGTLPRMAYEAHLANGALNGKADGEFRDFDPARVSANPRFAGHVSGTVNASFAVASISGSITPDAITADGRVTLAASEVAGLTIDSADVDGQYANRRGNLRRAVVKGPDLDAQASGPIALDQTGQSNVKYHVAATNLETLGKLAGQAIGGSAILDGTLTGNAAALVTTGTLDGSNLAYQENTALDLNSTYTVTLPSLELARVRVQAQTTATFVHAGGVQLNAITATTDYADEKLDFQTHLVQAPSGGQAEAAAGLPKGGGRELDAAGSVVVHPDHQELHLPSLALRTEGVEWTSAPGSESTVKYGNNQIEVKGVRLVNADQQLDVDGVFALGDNPQIGAINVSARNVDIAQLEKLALQNRGFSGRLNATATIAGSAKAPDVKGHLEIAGGAFQQFKYESLVTDATFTKNRIGLDTRLVQAPGVELTARGSIPMSAFKTAPVGVPPHADVAAADAIDLRIQSSRIDLGIVQGFTTELTNVTGTLQADVRVTGSGQDPHLVGYVELLNGAVGVVQGGVTFSGMTTKIELLGDRIHVPSFQVLDQHGKPLTISGELAVHERQAGAVNIAIESDDFKVLDNQLGNVHVESHLKLTGEVRRPRLEGELRADSARLELDRLLLMFSSPYAQEALPDVISAQETTTSVKGADDATRDAFARGREISAAHTPQQTAAAAEAAAPKTGIMSALALDVHFVAPGNLVLRGDDIRPGGATASQVGSLNATIGADVQIQKRPDGPITLRGTATTVRGFYEFQGRRFTIQRDGTMQFHGLAEINPDIDVTAERLIPNTGVTARIHVTGTAKAPQISLSSNPPLDEADILSLIVFNRSVNALGSGERASLAETAGGIASGFVASSLGRSIGKALDVDLFEITTNDPVTGETAGGVTLGKQLSDKAFVRFRQQFGQRSYTEFMLEYQLAKFLRLDTRVAPETSGVANRLTQRRVERGGIDLIFFFSY